MARLLFTVTDRFYIAGRGLIPVPGIVPAANERFRVGDPLLLKRPDGSEISSRIGGIEMPNPNPGPVIVFNLPELKKDDVPVGTQVWSVNAGTTPRGGS